MMTKFLIGVIVALGLLLAWGQFQNGILKFEKQVLITDNHDLTVERDIANGNVMTANAIIDLQIKQMNDSEIRITELNRNLKDSRENVDYVRKLFNGHNFANLLAKKPGLIEKRMIAATAKVLQELEDVTKP